MNISNAIKPVTDESSYQDIVNQVASITSGEHDLIANMANISAILFTSLSHVNWAGFYLYKESQLVLGPFQGNPACIRIPLGKGVCGTAASTKRVFRVNNVHEFAGHIACDAASNSEIVIPIIHHEQLIGVLDIDSPEYSRFNENDEKYLCEVVNILVNTIIEPEKVS